jgi:chromosome segregation ATPase
MILECGKCAKMYRVRDDASPQPTQCPTCGGDLRAAGGGVQTSAASRVKELETRIQNLERELEETRTSRPTLSVETAPGFSGFSAPVAELRSAAENSARLERELLALRSEMERKIKDKEREIEQLKDSSGRESAERRRQETRVSGIEETHARAIEGKDKTIAALDASIASYRSKVETLQKKLDAVEIQRLNDLNTFDSRVREREQSDRAALDRATETQQRAVADLRTEMEAKIEEKDRLITEGRQSLDREAGERRRLSETLNRLQETADRAVAEKATAIAALDATLSSYKSKIETLQKRVDSLEELRRTEHDQIHRQLSSRQSIRGRVDEASHLAVDLDHSLDSIEATIAAIRDRARRLKDTLQQADSEPEAPVPSLASASLAPEPEAEPVRPAFSQADHVWGPDSAEEQQVAEPAAAAVEPEPELAAPSEPEPEAAPAQEPEPEPEAPAYTPVTRTQIRSNRYAEPLPEAIEAVPSPEPSLLDSDPVGRLDEPSQIVTAVPVKAQEEKPAATGTDSSDDLPLISPPDEAARSQKEEPPKRKKFSWQRK